MQATIFDTSGGPRSLRGSTLTWRDYPALQQVRYASEAQEQLVLSTLSQAPTFVPADGAAALSALLAWAAEGRAFILQMGDCAESIHDANRSAVARKLDLLEAAADILTRGTGKSTIKIGRIGGQYAKPRSQPHETREGITLPAFLGESINGHAFDPLARAANPLRLLSAYFAAQRTHELIRSYNRRTWPDYGGHHVFTSHEALHLAFEDALSRTDAAFGRYNGCGHLLWIGARTNHPDQAHVHYCAGLANPIAVKVSPDTSAETIQRLHRRLNPHNTRGRLVFISRMGRSKVEAHLPPLLAALDGIGAEAMWMCDPMHGNTFAAPTGVKVRALSDIRAELDATIGVLSRHGRALAGVHLETSPEDIVECVTSRAHGHELQRVGPQFRSKCDPRLNGPQTLELCGWLAARLGAARSDPS